MYMNQKSCKTSPVFLLYKKEVPKSLIKRQTPYVSGWSSCNQNHSNSWAFKRVHTKYPTTITSSTSGKKLTKWIRRDKIKKCIYCIISSNFFSLVFPMYNTLKHWQGIKHVWRWPMSNLKTCYLSMLNHTDFYYIYSYKRTSELIVYVFYPIKSPTSIQ